MDHQEGILKRARTLLVKEGIDVYETVSGKQAIEEAKRLEPDIIVLDYSLPDLTGVQVAYEIRQFLQKVKIVFFTIHDEAVISAAARVTPAQQSPHPEWRYPRGARPKSRNLFRWFDDEAF